MAIPGVFRKVGAAKKKVDKASEKAEPVDQSIFRIGVYGHKGVGKTVYFTITYACSKQSPEFELMALGETQEILEEKYNLMRGQGMDLGSGKRISERRFPPLSTGEQKLDFEVRIGKNTIVPVNTIDYSGELIYIDARGDIKQNLIEFFKNCECVLFFIDPDAIQNEGERSNRIAAFTDLIGQLSGFEKRLKVPVGLVITKADELPGFKSAEQSSLIGKGNGYIRAMNFAGFLRGVLKQRIVASRPEWRNDLESMLNRLESFFKPLLNRTMDYQVFFVSSTGNSPEVVSDSSGAKIRIPPEDLRPLGVSQPLKWAISRINSYRQGFLYGAILKWTFLVVALIIDLLAFGHFYNYFQANEVNRKVSSVVIGLSDSDGQIAKAYRGYAEDFIVRTFFADFSRKAYEEVSFYSNKANRQAIRDVQERFNRLISDTDGKLAGLGALKSDSAKYEAAKVEITKLLDDAEALAKSVTDPKQQSDMLTQIAPKRQELLARPSGGQMVATQNLKDKYEALVTDFHEQLAALNYDYLLGSAPGAFPSRLKAFKDSIATASPDDPLAAAYSRRIQSYLTEISTNIQPGIAIPFRLDGADGGENGYSIYFVDVAEAQRGALDNSSQSSFRVPVVSTEKFAIQAHTGARGLVDTYTSKSGYEILKLNGKRIPFTDTNINIRMTFDLTGFYAHFKDLL